MRSIGLGTTVLIVAVCLDRSAFAIDFDFETTPLGANQGGLTVMNGGLSLTVTPEGNPIGFVHAAGGVATGMGNAGVIGNNFDPLRFGEFLPLRFTFTQLVKDITFVFGDQGGDEDSPVTINAYNSASVLLGTLNSVYAVDQSIAGTVGGSFAGAKYFIASSGSTIGNEDSLYWEVRGVTPVPESTTVLLLALGTLASAGLTRRLRRQCA